MQILIDGWPKIEEFHGIAALGEAGSKYEPREEVLKANKPQDRVRDFGGHYVNPEVAAGPDKGSRAKMKLLLKDVGGKPRVVGLVTGSGALPD